MQVFEGKYYWVLNLLRNLLVNVESINYNETENSLEHEGSAS